MQVFGHRGAPGFPRRSENTIGSFRRAVQAGADGFELDVRRCGDGQIVVIHDDTIDRTTNGSGSVSSFNYADLARFDAGGGEPPPLLTSVLDSFAETHCIYIELKETGLVEDVLRLIAARGVERNIVICSFDRDDSHGAGPAWEELGAADPLVSIGLLTTPAKLQRMGLDNYIRTAQDLRAFSLQVARQAVDPTLVKRAHGAGLAVGVFTVNTLDEVRHFYSIGADAVFTDFPEQAARLRIELHHN